MTSENICMVCGFRSLCFDIESMSVPILRDISLELTSSHTRRPKIVQHFSERIYLFFDTGNISGRAMSAIHHADVFFKKRIAVLKRRPGRHLSTLHKFRQSV